MKPLLGFALFIALFCAIISIASALNPRKAIIRVEKRITVIGTTEFYEVDGKAHWRELDEKQH